MEPAGDNSNEQAVDARVVRTRNDVLRAALDVVIEQGSDALTHAHVAQVAGYSKATLYKHWPRRADLLAAAFTRLADVPHHTPTGDLRTDLILELSTFRDGMREHRLDRALAVLLALTASTPEMVDVRDRLVADGERVVRRLLAPVLHGSELEAATLMLCGALVQTALLHGQPPSDDVISSAVDLVLRGLDLTPPVGVPRPDEANPTLIPVP